MVNVSLFQNLTLYLLIFMKAYIYMFTSFFKNLHQSTLTITDMKFQIWLANGNIILNSPSVCGLRL